MSFFNNAKFVAAVPSSNPFMIYSRHADRYLDNDVCAPFFFLFGLLDSTLYFFIVICYLRNEFLRFGWLVLEIYLDECLN